jgi:hypothetical protein
VAFLTLPILQPQLNNNGIFTASYTFPEAGEYKMWADAKSKGSAQCLAAFRLSEMSRVNPSTRPQDLCLTQRFYKKSIDANYQVRVILPEKVVTHRNVDQSCAGTAGSLHDKLSKAGSIQNMRTTPAQGKYNNGVLLYCQGS